MTQASVNITDWIAGLFPFNHLSKHVLENLSKKARFLRYRMGEMVITRGVTPNWISVIYFGQVRLLGWDSHQQKSVTLKKLQPGEVLGWISLVRSIPCESAIASDEVVCLNINADDFLALIQEEPAFAQALQTRSTLIELYDLLGEELNRRADANTDLAALADRALSVAWVQTLPSNKQPKLDPEFLWLVSSSSLADIPVGSRWDSKYFHLSIDAKIRLAGIPKSLIPSIATSTLAPASEDDWLGEIPYASSISTIPKSTESPKTEKYPYIRARGQLDGALACFQMLSEYFKTPGRRDLLRRMLSKQYESTKSLSLQFCGGVAEIMGLTTQLVTVPAVLISRLPMPIMITWQDSFAIIYKSANESLLIAVPEMGLVHYKSATFNETWGESGEVLLLSASKQTPQRRFSLSWFGPSLRRYRKVLIEVLIASMLIQIFGLVNPLVTQVVIDKVIIGNSSQTLEAIGIFLIVVAVAESILSAVRTQLFVNTTNRIDMSLGSEVINHLLRLPITYFERRPVGELATRVGELENIRQFLTGTALTVVMDGIFSAIYIAVMVIYNWMLTVVALSTVPLFAALNLLVSPVIRRQLQDKAERNSLTYSYLVEVMSGIQTVKAQNLELRSRWQWQERYSSYISAGFKTIATQTTASAISNFLNKLSNLLVLWVGAYLVLNQKLTLGQLISFRIISGYVTNPLLRLVQLWQDFQEVALSLQRIADILDTPQETETKVGQNILMPSIVGDVRYENISFSFRQNSPMQLRNINLDIPGGTFVGIVGQSGSGKSTLLKLLPRLYEPNSGKILIDGYDISKVELYSLRCQIGVVLQDTLLFDGTVRDNIALGNPDASDEEIIAAAKVAYAHEFIMNLPQGYSTSVGERGSALSGGQRQRVAIARTVLQNPQLLILDEATSSLDYNAEALVCRNLAETFKSKTVFFITHRLNNIRDADIILMMERGTIVEKGTFDELMSLKGYFYCLYQQQEAQI